MLLVGLAVTEKLFRLSHSQSPNGGMVVGTDPGGKEGRRLMNKFGEGRKPKSIEKRWTDTDDNGGAAC
jgi:hypothetical protein